MARNPVYEFAADDVRRLLEHSIAATERRPDSNQSYDSKLYKRGRLVNISELVEHDSLGKTDHIDGRKVPIGLFIQVTPLTNKMYSPVAVSIESNGVGGEATRVYLLGSKPHLETVRPDASTNGYNTFLPARLFDKFLVMGATSFKLSVGASITCRPQGIPTQPVDVANIVERAAKKGGLAGCRFQIGESMYLIKVVGVGKFGIALYDAYKRNMVNPPFLVKDTLFNCQRFMTKLAGQTS